jgi:hypothetical protein
VRFACPDAKQAESKKVQAMATGAQTQLTEPPWVRLARFGLTVITLLASLATLYALRLSLKQEKDSRAALQVAESQAKNLDQMVGSLDQFVKELSTQYLGPFPSAFKELPRFVSPDPQHPSTLDIVSDYAGPADYSDPAQSLLYIQALERFPPKATIKLLIFSNDVAEREIKAQFEAKFEEAKNKAITEPDSPMRRFLENRSELKGCFESWEQRKRFYSDLKLGNFVQIVMHDETAEQKKLQERLGKALTIQYSDAVSPLFIWLFDGKAIFAIHRTPAADPDFTYYFKTIDGSMVQAYQKLFESLWTENQKKAKQTEIKTVPFPDLSCK